jgi:hypothetical protein
MSAVSKNASDVTEPVSVTSSRVCLLAALPRNSLTPRGPAATISNSSRPCRDILLLLAALPRYSLTPRGPAAIYPSSLSPSSALSPSSDPGPTLTSHLRPFPIVALLDSSHKCLLPPHL